MTRVLITGSRNFANEALMREVLCQLEAPVELCHGGARGADTLAGDIAQSLGYEVCVYPANWEKYGKRAGSLRNQEMLDDFKPEVVIAFPLPGSIGTWDMVQRAKAADIPVRIVEA